MLSSAQRGRCGRLQSQWRRCRLSLAQFLSTWEKRSKSKQHSNLWVYALEMIRVSCKRTRISENKFQHVAQTRRGASQKRAEIMGDGEIQRLLRAAAQTRIRRGQRRIDRYRERADVRVQAVNMKGSNALIIVLNENPNVMSFSVLRLKIHLN